MILTKKTSIGGAYARKKSYEYEGKQFEADLKDGDIIKILSSGEIVTGEHGEQFVVKVQTRNGEKNLSMNQTSINNCVEAFGEDSEKYLGKDVKVWILKMMVAGKLQNVAYLAHPTSEMTEDGTFLNKSITEEVKTGGYTGEVANVNEVPFP